MKTKDLPRYSPDGVPDYLFTRNELKYMGLVPLNVEGFDGLVNYSDQKREYKLFHIEKTRKPKPQQNKGISLTITDMSVQDIHKKKKKI